jgi:hypothetical protein
VIKTIPAFRTGFSKRREVGSVREKDVGTAVAVVIEDRQTTRHRFDHMLLGSGAIMQNELNAALCGDILKAYGSDSFSRMLERRREDGCEGD